MTTLPSCPFKCRTMDMDGIVCKSCVCCIRYIGVRAVNHQRNNKIHDQEMSRLIEMSGNGYQRGPFPTFKKLPLGFPGIFLGFDSKSYAYIRHPENELTMEKEYRDMQIEMSEFYSSNKNLKKFLNVVIVVLGELCAYEEKPKHFIRVQIICVSKRSNVVLAVNLDTGKIYEVDPVQLYLPVKIFFKLPFQVIRCKLFNLEDHLGTNILEIVWRKMNSKLKHYKMTIIKVGVVPSVLFLGEDSTISVNSEILDAIEKYNQFPEPYKEKVAPAPIKGFFIEDIPVKPSYPGSTIHFFPNNLF